MNNERAPLRWNIERRLNFIELRLYWEGRINRSDLVDFFGISVPQASQDLAHYDELAPGNLLYDKTAKTYVAGPTFTPVVTTPSADAYLAQLRSMTTGGLAAGESWIGRPPSFLGAPRLRRVYDREVLRRLVHAILTRQEFEAVYLSFSDDTPSSRRIAPHALGFDGQRWHVRAFCFRSLSFRDFVIGRLALPGDPQPTLAQSGWDLEWSDLVTMRLAANPRLPETMRAAVEHDHGMTDGALEVSLSICSSYYLESQLNLDLDASFIPIRRQQLILLNRDDVTRARDVAKTATATLIAASGLDLAQPT
jgi:hypothetical protein